MSDDLRQSILAYLNAKRDDVPLVRDGVFVITGGRRQNKATVTVFAQTAKTVRTLSRQHGLTSAELLEQMVNFCIERMQQ